MKARCSRWLPKHVPGNSSRSALAVAVVLILDSWVSPVVFGDSTQLVPALLITLIGAAIIWVEVRTLAYWRRNQDYAAAAGELRSAWENLPADEWCRTSAGNLVQSRTSRRRLSRCNLLFWVDGAEAADAFTAVMHDGAPNALITQRLYQQRRPDHRVRVFTGMHRCWPDGSQENALPTGGFVHAARDVLWMSRAGLLDVSVAELRQLAAELQGAEPIDDAR